MHTHVCGKYTWSPKFGVWSLEWGRAPELESRSRSKELQPQSRVSSLISRVNARSGCARLLSWWTPESGLAEWINHKRKDRSRSSVDANVFASL